MKDCSVLFQQVEAQLAWTLAYSCADHNHIGICQVGIAACDNLHGSYEGQAMVEVHHFSLGAGCIHIDEDQFISQALLYQ